MPDSDNPFSGASAGPAHCVSSFRRYDEGPFPSGKDCYASDGSCVTCDAGYVPVDSIGGALPASGGDPDYDLAGAYTCCALQEVRPRNLSGNPAPFRM